MGAWGTAIFSDDTASDVRSDYRAMLESGASDAQATADILHTYTADDTVMWLALAASQSKLGRLDPVVKARAVEIIDTGEDLAQWEDAAPAEQRGRQQALTRLRQTLTGPQPERRTIKLKWSHHTDLQLGDVLAFAVESVSALWVVVAVQPDPALGTHPMIRRLRHAGIPPSTVQEVLDRMQSGEIVPDPSWSEIWAVRMKRRDFDWAAAGFTKLEVPVVATAPSVLRTPSYIGISWAEITEHVHNGTSPGAAESWEDARQDLLEAIEELRRSM